MEGDISAQLAKSVLEYGFPGVVIIVLALVIRALWQDNKELRTSLFETGVTSAKAIEANTASLNRMSDLLVRGKEI